MAADLTVSGEQKISDAAGGFTGALSNDDRFGDGVTNLGDLDGDGTVDIATGAGFDDDGGSDHGAVWILFLDPGGTVKSFQKISDTQGGFTATLDTFDLFGSQPVNIGDFDGDGVIDLAAGARFDDDGGSNRGAMYVLFLNSNGTVKAHQKISDTVGGFTGVLDNNDRFGTHTTSLGDLDGDGVTDLAVGAALDDDGGSGRGAVWVLFMNSNGTVNTHAKISQTSGGFGGTLSDLDRFGTALASLGDLDGDGIVDLAVGVPFDDDGASGAGAVWILFLNANGTVKAEQKISNLAGNFAPVLQMNDAFSAVANAGDRDGDGINDLYVGASQRHNFTGALFVLLLNANGTVKQQQEITNGVGGFGGAIVSGDGFGSGAVDLGDIDGDSIPDFAAGANADDDGGHDRGAVWIVFNSVGPADLTPPNVAISDIAVPADGYLPFQGENVFPATVGTAPITVNGTATDDTTLISVDVNGVPATLSGVGSWAAAGVALAAGSNTITVTATDSSGNEGMAAVQITLDQDLDNDGIENSVDRLFDFGFPFGGPFAPSPGFSDQFVDFESLGSGTLASIFTVPGGDRSYVVNHTANSVSVLDTNPLSPDFNTVIAGIVLEDYPYGMAVHPAGTRIYVPNWGSNSTSVIDTVTNTVVKSIPVGTCPLNATMHPAGTRVYVANHNSDSVSVIDTATDTVIATVPVPGGAIQAAVTPDGSRAYVTIEGKFVSVIDTVANVLLPGSIVTGLSPVSVAVTPDGTRAYVTNAASDTVAVIDTATNTVGPGIPVGDVPLYLSISPDGSRVYVPNREHDTVSVIDTATDTVVTTIGVGNGPYYAAVSPDGTTVHVPNYNQGSAGSVSVIDTATNTVSATLLGTAGGTSFGYVQQVGGQILSISDEPSPFGIRIKADVSGSFSNPAFIDVCGGTMQFPMFPGFEFIVTCGSSTIEVVNGSADATFTGLDGSTSTATIGAGNALTMEFDAVDLIVGSPPTFSTPATNADPIVVEVDGEAVVLDPGVDVTPSQTGGEGCTPKFWKKPKHFGSWEIASPSDSFDAVFGVTNSQSGTLNLFLALRQGGSGERALRRAAVAALLNATSPEVSFLYDAAEVIDIVQDAYATGDFAPATDLLAAENELVCPLD